MKFKNEGLIFRRLPTDCWVITNKKLNRDGYYRKVWGNSRKSNKEVEMFHRFIWRAHHGDIPAGYEINHKCNNRACCNIEHLECLSREEHLILTNKYRWMAPSGKLLK